MVPNVEMETLNMELVGELRRRFFEKVEQDKPDFCEEDLERVRYDDLWLGRWLAMKHDQVEDSLVRLFECCQWRKEYETNEIKESELHAHIFRRGSILIRNEDRDGKKLLILVGRNHTRKHEELEIYKKGLIFFLEKIEFESNSAQITLLLDMTGTTYKNIDLKLMYYACTTVKQYYPYFLNFLIIYNLPWYLTGFIPIAKKWLPEKFMERLKFADRDTLGLYISPKNRLVEWGGDDDYVYEYVPENNPVLPRKSRKDLNFNDLHKEPAENQQI